MSDTPVIDANEFLMNDIGGMVVESRFVRPIEQELADLRRWKAEALSVMPPLQEIGREIGATLGQSIHDKILPELIRRREEIERLREAFKKPHPASPGYSSGEDNPPPRIFGGDGY